LQNRAKIVVLASHSDKVIHQMCNKVLWMDRGRLRAFGPIDLVIEKYTADQLSSVR
jgi:ABC-type polysaccharide/polyol phosphate transport system ATPase subunit